MKIGYARVSTREQNPALQVDALKAVGCERIYQDVASGAKTARPALDELLGQLRAGDVLVIWKLDRMGRSLKHLVELVGNLMERKVGLLSLNDPIDTTSAQGRFVFNLFATLAEFERELIRERTQAGLTVRAGTRSGRRATHRTVAAGRSDGAGGRDPVPRAETVGRRHRTEAAPVQEHAVQLPATSRCRDRSVQENGAATIKHVGP
nr:recombinase family protein [Xanthomonas citri]